MISGTALNTHDWAWLNDHLPVDGSVVLKNITASLTCFGIWGPAARDMMAKLTGADLSTAAMPFLSMRETSIGNIPVQLVRVTFVGELGYEIYAAAENGWSYGINYGLPASYLV